MTLEAENAALRAALTTAFNLLANTDWWGRQEQPPPEHDELWRQIQELQEQGVEIG
jgi:hypothetical protein